MFFSLCYLAPGSVKTRKQKSHDIPLQCCHLRQRILNPPSKKQPTTSCEAFLSKLRPYCHVRIGYSSSHIYKATYLCSLKRPRTNIYRLYMEFLTIKERRYPYPDNKSSYNLPKILYAYFIFANFNAEQKQSYKYIFHQNLNLL